MTQKQSKKKVILIPGIRPHLIQNAVYYYKYISQNVYVLSFSIDIILKDATHFEEKFHPVQKLKLQPYIV